MVAASYVLVEAASKGPRVRRRGAHTRLLLARDRTVVLRRDDLVRDGPVRRYGPWID